MPYWQIGDLKRSDRRSGNNFVLLHSMCTWSSSRLGIGKCVLRYCSHFIFRSALWNYQIRDLAITVILFKTIHSFSRRLIDRSAIWNGEFADLIVYCELAIIVYYYILCDNLAAALELVKCVLFTLLYRHV